MLRGIFYLNSVLK